MADKDNKKEVWKVVWLIVICIAIFLAIYLPLKLNGLLDEEYLENKIQQIVESGGFFSYLIFFLIQFLQTTLLPIPAFITTVIGANIFGPFIGFLISFLAVLSGSIFSFFIGRKLGRAAINKFIGEETSDKWLKKLEKGKYVFFLMMLFPVFPDDILCLLAGITPITFKFFLITNLITRPIGLFCISYFGSGYLIPFEGWGIPVWIIFIILACVAFILTIKYQDKIEEFIIKINNKISLKRTKKGNIKQLSQNEKKDSDKTFDNNENLM